MNKLDKLKAMSTFAAAASSLDSEGFEKMLEDKDVQRMLEEQAYIDYSFPRKKPTTPTNKQQKSRKKAKAAKQARKKNRK